tara:strand:+ start:241 stop:924 length:684 start_codon:yes stop_codon:yes gene_type:complete
LIRFFRTKIVYSLLNIVFVLVFSWLIFIGCSRTDNLLGTILDNPLPAPEFSLQNQFGNTVSISDYRGRVVVLTFLYSYCEDICPIVSNYFQQTYQLLGDDTDKVAFVIVSVDPKHDTIENVYKYSDDRGMLHKWSYLVGDEGQLKRVWISYYIDPTLFQNTEYSDEINGNSTSSGTVDGFRDSIGVGYEIIHSAPIYLIDPNGIMRVLFTLPLDPVNLVHDVKLLIE